MSERLSQLLHEEATGVQPPPPAPARIVTEGRRLRLRRRVVNGLAAAAAVAALGAGAAVAAVLGGPPGDPDTADLPRDAAVYGWRSELYVGDETVPVDGIVDRVDLTAPGWLVRTSDQRFVLVPTDGTSSEVEGPSDGGVATDPDSDLYAFSQDRAGGQVVTVRDIESGEQVAQLPVPEGFQDSGVRLDDGVVYLQHGRQGVAALDVTTGDTSTVHTAADWLDVRGGRMLLGNQRTFSVVDAETARERASVRTDAMANASLSPDGRWLVVVGNPEPGALVTDPQTYPVTFHDLDSGTVAGTTTRTADSPYGFGWTRGGDLFWVDGDTITRCEPATATCEEHQGPSELPDYAEATVADVW